MSQQPSTASLARIAPREFLPATILILLKSTGTARSPKGSAKAQGERILELRGKHRRYIHKINVLTAIITIWCRGICATSAHKKVRAASDEAVFCCVFRTLRLLSELRRRGASRGRPVRWFA